MTARLRSPEVQLAAPTPRVIRQAISMPHAWHFPGRITRILKVRSTIVGFTKMRLLRKHQTKLGRHKFCQTPLDWKFAQNISRVVVPLQGIR